MLAFVYSFNFLFRNLGYIFYLYPIPKTLSYISERILLNGSIVSDVSTSCNGKHWKQWKQCGAFVAMVAIRSVSRIVAMEAMGIVQAVVLY